MVQIFYARGTTRGLGQHRFDYFYTCDELVYVYPVRKSVQEYKQFIDKLISFISNHEKSNRYSQSKGIFQSFVPLLHPRDGHPDKLPAHQKCFLHNEIRLQGGKTAIRLNHGMEANGHTRCELPHDACYSRELDEQLRTCILVATAKTDDTRGTGYTVIPTAARAMLRQGIEDVNVELRDGPSDHVSCISLTTDIILNFNYKSTGDESRSHNPSKQQQPHPFPGYLIIIDTLSLTSSP